MARSVPDLLDYGQIKATATGILMIAAERWAAANGPAVTAGAFRTAHGSRGVTGCRRPPCREGECATDPVPYSAGA